MELSRALLVVGITLLVVVLLNVSIYLSLSRKNTHGSIEYLQRAAKGAKSPWKNEDDDLLELSRLVKSIQQQNEDPKEGDAGKKQD